MKITIAERLHPYSHRPGTRFILPQNQLVGTDFPHTFRIY